MEIILYIAAFFLTIAIWSIGALFGAYWYDDTDYVPWLLAVLLICAVLGGVLGIIGNI